ncbi:MAG: ImmA/IrrE family metallo-endopeptidase [Candidatus Cryptobacteroides sp.]
MTESELLSEINVDLKTPITWENIDADEIEINHLKRIDKVFNKGLLYYSDPTTPRKDKGMSVFFRKENFTTELNIGAKKRVREFEDLKTQISAICKLSRFSLKRTLATFTVADDPKMVAFLLRDSLLPTFTSVKRDFLKNFINKLGDNNVLVFEFVDTYNKKEKANIDGFYIEPNAIVLKRNQEALKREIFTLAHEVGHYLLQQEEVDEIDFSKITEDHTTISDVESWCNTFANNLLLGPDNAAKLDAIARFDYHIDYGHDLISQISKGTNLSRLAIFTNIFLQHKMTFADYSNVRDDLHQQWIDKIERESREREEAKAAGIIASGRSPKPIQSDLVSDIYNYALNRGVISEQEYCSALNIKSDDISRIFYEGRH